MSEQFHKITKERPRRWLIALIKNPTGSSHLARPSHIAFSLRAPNPLNHHHHQGIRGSPAIPSTPQTPIKTAPPHSYIFARPFVVYLFISISKDRFSYSPIYLRVNVYLYFRLYISGK